MAVHFYTIENHYYVLLVAIRRSSPSTRKVIICMGDSGKYNGITTFRLVENFITQGRKQNYAIKLKRLVLPKN